MLLATDIEIVEVRVEQGFQASDTPGLDSPPDDSPSY